MKITFWPESKLGKWAAGLGIAFVVLMLLKAIPGMPLPSMSIAALGFAGFVCGLIAVVKKERAILVFLAIFVGLIMTAWIIGELIYPH